MASDPLSFDGWHLAKGRLLWLADDGTQFDDKEIATSTRIGVTSGKEHPLRFFLRDGPCVSGPSRSDQ
ncbi:MAG: DNA-3-methyladenine glycosylase [Verrucomicrobia bacterium]|nr:DNA-3-methyladenine glycosylase [Verrucomicrobiota bacterium]